MTSSDEFPGFSAPSSRTLSDHVTHQLRQAVLTGKLKPGQRIVEREIAEAMNTSRGPVRDALKYLENERLVVRYPHKGTFVAWLSLKDAEEIYSLREAIESRRARHRVDDVAGPSRRSLVAVADRADSRRRATAEKSERTPRTVEVLASHVRDRVGRAPSIGSNICSKIGTAYPNPSS